LKRKDHGEANLGYRFVGQKGKMMRKEDMEKMNNMKWYHKIDLGDHIITPGNEWDHLWNPLKEYMKRVDFSNKRVLDVGCWDGLWSFEAEKLGAREVWAIDLNSQRSFSEQGFETFEFAKKHLESKVHYKEVSVYDLEDSFREPFDIVVCFGVLYHLRYPQLGLARIRNILKTGGMLLLETALLLDTPDTIIQTDYREIYPIDVSIWNAFSEPALLRLLEESYLQPEEHHVILRQDEERKIGRIFVKAQAFEGKHYHHYFPDPFLKKHFIALGE